MALALVFVNLFFSDCRGKDVQIGQPQITDSAARANHPDKKILIVVSAHSQLGNTGKKTGYWLGEVTHFYHVVARHGFAVDFVSPGGAPSVMDPGSFDKGDPVNRSFLADKSLKEKLSSPLSPEKINPGDYIAIYYAGGHGTMWDFPDAKAISDVASRINENSGVVSAVCHGPAGLLNIKLADGKLLISGKKVTGFANIEETIVMKKSAVPYLLEDALKERGGVYSKSFLPFVAHVVTDGRLITGQNPFSAAGVGEALMEVLAKK
ncbi:MAG: type 1 glutamine amidotransferase domain-containing protein [Leptospira sp.]|nr:type 1 glutamine amidotransferase domain-containing protein [Leptospira sp.]